MTTRPPANTLWLGTWLLLAALAGCDTSIDASDYDQSCAVDEDCVLIIEGDDICCSCPNAAINKQDQDAYEDDRPDCSGGGCEMSCPDSEAWCDAGRCDLH